MEENGRPEMRDQVARVVNAGSENTGPGNENLEMTEHGLTYKSASM